MSALDYVFAFPEILGYLATIAILVSFMMKDMKNLRIISVVGCTLFVLYEVLGKMSYPIIITNGSILLINLYYLLLKKT